MPCRVFGGVGRYSVTCGYDRYHQAIDLIPGTDTTWDILAHSDGRVSWCQDGYGNALGSSGNASYGNCVKIEHKNGYATLYAHMHYITVDTDMYVKKGQKIGVMGNTGNSDGSHLHFEVWIGGNYGGNRVNPSSYVTGPLPGLSDEESGGDKDDDDNGGGGGGSPGKDGTWGEKQAQQKKTVDITEVKVVSVQGAEGKRENDSLSKTKVIKTGCEILVQNGKNIYAPVLIDKVTVEWSRKSTPGSLKFDCVLDKALKITEGNPVSFRYNGKNVFYGYIFEKSQSDKDKLTVSCYDQLRYFKNKTTLAYAEKSYSEILKELAGKYRLRCGSIQDTKYKLPKRLEDGTVFDILGNASDETVMKKGDLFVLYDEYGKLCLKKIDSMFVPIMIDESSASKFKYSSTIDKNVYTRIILTQDNDESGVRELYVANNESGQKNWGVLDYYEAQNEMGTTEIKEAAKLLANYYGKKQRTLSLQSCFGDVRVRGGSSLVVYMNLNDKKIRNIMVVEKVKHSFESGIHTMDLDLCGVKGEFNV